MDYAGPEYTTEHTAVSRHNRADDICKEFGYSVGENAPRENLRPLLDMLKDNSPAGKTKLRDIFTQMANVKQDGKGTLTILHAVSGIKDDVNYTNNKAATFHAHVFGKDFEEDYAHITDPNTKTYVATPNPDIASAIKDTYTGDKNDFQVSTLGTEAAEAKSHQILSHQKFKSFKDFMNNASNQEWDTFKEHMIELIEPTVQEGAGGSRIVIDDRYFTTGAFTVQVLSGENLHSSGKPARWFDKTAPEPSP